MNSLQIDYMNALANQERNRIMEDDVRAKVAESSAKRNYLLSQHVGQQLDNYRNSEQLSLLPLQIKNSKYRLDMDNAMLFNTVDWWVNGGKKLSNWANRRWNPYWNTQGNMGREFHSTITGLNNMLALPLAPIRGVVKVGYDATPKE